MHGYLKFGYKSNVSNYLDELLLHDVCNESKECGLNKQVGPQKSMLFSVFERFLSVILKSVFPRVSGNQFEKYLVDGGIEKCAGQFLALCSADCQSNCKECLVISGTSTETSSFVFWFIPVTTECCAFDCITTNLVTLFFSIF